mmetsp:Transcript_48967/g.109809  ORF Transcript_48967/g.109809 Transcript_48967/m.109809 type:complete len:291 (+) Transcript_48967:66-938(+)|eukprot:300575-Amphidinium_carterae.1
MGCADSKTAAIAAPTAATKQSAKRRPEWAGKHFQVKLVDGWKDYSKDEDVMITRAFLVGQQHCRFTFKSARYEIDFKRMIQTNLETGKERQIRAPPGMKAPKNPLVPAGPMIVLTVKAGQPGSIIKVGNPNDAGREVEVAVPKTAKVGSKLAVALPAKGETAADVVKKQEGMGLRTKVAVGTTVAVVAAGGVIGGVVLGDHLTGGGLGTEGMVADAGDAIADAAADAGDAIAGAADDAGETIAEAIVDAAPHVEVGAADAVEWAEGAGEDVAAWFEDLGDTLGDTIMDLF